LLGVITFTAVWKNWAKPPALQLWALVYSAPY